MRKLTVLGGARSLRAVVLSVCFACGVGFVGVWAARARAQGYPYTLIDPGTFGGPGSFLDEPGVSIMSNGAILGAADTTTPDSDFPNCPPPGGCYDSFVQHAFVWNSGHLTDLGALPGENSSAIYGLNGRGVGAGFSEDGGVDPFTGTASGVAVLFKNGHVSNLGTLPGGHQSFAQDINDRGQIAGDSSNGTPDPFSFFGWGTQTRGFVWKNGVMRDLGTLGGADTVEYVQNQGGQIAGWSYTNSTANAATGIPTTDPFLWENGHMIDLGTLGGVFGVTNWMNDRGEVVGRSDLTGDQNAHPFLWQNGHMIDLGTPNGDLGFANYINPRGDSTGAYLASDGNFHALLWRGRRMSDLPPVGGAAQAFGDAVNDQDQVVGVQFDSSFNEVSAALWTGGHGYDLNTLVAPSGFQMISADQINDQGVILGHGVYTSGPNAGDQRIFILIPNPSVPLPAPSAPSPPTATLGKRHIAAIEARLAHSHRLPGAMRPLPFGPAP